MAKKTTTKKKQTSGTRKKATRKKTTKKTRAEDAGKDEEMAATAESDDATKTKKKTRRKTTRKKTTTKRASGETGEKSAPSKRRKTTRKKSTRKAEAQDNEQPRVEEADGQIIIRFPPAAPSPFESTAPEEEEEQLAPSFDADLESIEDEPPRKISFPPVEIEEPPESDDFDKRETPEPEPEPERPVRRKRAAREDTPEDDGEPISRSKKRRLRRQRSRMRKEPGEDPAEEETDAGKTHELRADVDTTHEAVDDDPTPWLEAAESIKHELSEAELAKLDDLTQIDADEEPAPTDTKDEDEEEDTEETDTAPEEPHEKPRRRRRRGRRSRHETPDAEPLQAAEPKAAREARPPATRVKEMIINAVPREECRIAVLCKGRLEEIYLERAAFENHVGNIYKGVVTNVESSIQAAFIDFGQGKNGFLHISDLHPKYFPNGGGKTENVGHKMPRRSRPPIQRCLRRGQQVIVQVTKEGIGTKGPTLSTYLSIPGRYLVMMPGMGRLGVSRRIEDDDSRDKLRKVLAELELPDSMGFIARTAALDRTKRELQGDLTYLTRLWRAVEKRMKEEQAPAELYRESDLVIRTIRDVFTADIERIVVDDPEVGDRAREFLSIFSPRSSDIVTTYTAPEPIFHKYGIEAELERLHSRRVPLKSGGSLVIEPTEALVAIDVNSGRFRTEEDAETTAFKINTEAADEIARQLRLRDLGGVVICDFIDMRQESHRREIERRLARNLRDHKERAKVLRTSQFGIIELTRQRQRASLTRSVYQDCRHCRGTGLVKTIESVALDVLRVLQLAVTRSEIRMIEVAVSPDVAFLLLNRKRRLLHELESNNRRIISIRPNTSYGLDQVEIRCMDARGRVVPYT